MRRKLASKRNNVRYFVVVFDSEVTVLTFDKNTFYNQKFPNTCAGLFHRAENDTNQMENSFHRLILK